LSLLMAVSQFSQLFHSLQALPFSTSEMYISITILQEI
jgi:hypothetical protein